MNIELAHSADAQPIAEMSRHSIEHGFPWRWRPERVRTCVHRHDTNVIVTRAERALVGFAIMQYGDCESHLLLLAVASTHRRVGVGTQLVDWLEETARVAGIERITLEVRATNTLAQRFYRRLGFECHEHLRGYYEGIEDALRMCKVLRCDITSDRGVS